jgi:hypothetical protein
MRKKLITLMMIFASLGTMYVSANAETSGNPNKLIGLNSLNQQVRYVRYGGRLYRVRVQRVSRYRRNRYYRPRARYIRVPRIRFYRSYNRRYNRPRVRYSRYYNYSRY